MCVVIVCTSSLICLMILEIIPSYMAFDASKCPLCNIKKWIIWLQTKVEVLSIFKSLLYFMRSLKWDTIHEDELLSINARNDLGLNKFYDLVIIVGTKCDIVCNNSDMTHCNHQRRILTLLSWTNYGYLCPSKTTSQM